MHGETKSGLSRVLEWLIVRFYLAMGWKSVAIGPIPRKAVIIGGFGRSVETTAGLAGQYSALAQFGLPLEKLQTYSADINAVTTEQAGAAAKAYYDPAGASLIVVGDADQFWDQVK